MEQPTGGDGEGAWRRYAGWLRQRLGEANERAEAEADEKVQRARAHIRGVERRSRALTARNARLLASKLRDRRMLDRLEELLHEGDLPAAVDLLAERRAGIEGWLEAREAWEAEQ